MDVYQNRDNDRYLFEHYTKDAKCKLGIVLRDCKTCLFKYFTETYQLTISLKIGLHQTEW